jgi:hypothetical protein
MKVAGTISFLASMGYLQTEFMEAWAQMVQFNERYLCTENMEVYYLKSKGSMHSTMRNWLAENFLGDWLLQVDADHVFEADAAYRLIRHMEEYNAPAISGMYFRKKAPFVPEAHILDKKTQMMSACTAWDQDVVRVDGTGAGFLAVRRDVFEQIRVDLGEQPFSVSGSYSEDFSFCMRLRKLGIPLLLDTTVQIGHLGVRIYDIEDFTGTGTYPGRVDDISKIKTLQQDDIKEPDSDRIGQSYLQAG